MPTTFSRGSRHLYSNDLTEQDAQNIATVYYRLGYLGYVELSDNYDENGNAYRDKFSVWLRKKRDD
jgi:hypothetical protein